jgi:hypothetical protein
VVVVLREAASSVRLSFPRALTPCGKVVRPAPLLAGLAAVGEHEAVIPGVCAEGTGGKSLVERFY